MATIPIIDISSLIQSVENGSYKNLANEPNPELIDVVNKIGTACRTIGFFYVVNHGVEPFLIDSVYREATEYFSLPNSVKTESAIQNSKTNRGYVSSGTEALDPGSGVTDPKEAFNIGVDYDADQVRQLSPTNKWVGANQWPRKDVCPNFRDTMKQYFARVLSIARALHIAFCIDLKVTPLEFFDPYMGYGGEGSADPLAFLRLLHYTFQSGEQNETTVLAGAHTDYGNITLLSQDDAGGLQVLRRNDKSRSWVIAPPVPYSFIVNIGDCLMRWTNNVYVSTPHRVVQEKGRMPRKPTRLSVAFFCDLAPGAPVVCLPSCLGSSGAQYDPITVGEYLTDRLNKTYVYRQATDPPSTPPPSKL